MTPDIAIVGGGLTGAALLLALSKLNISATLIESTPFSGQAAGFDARTLALAPASKCILDNLGLWESLEPFVTPIHTIHISQQKTFGVATLKKREVALGYVVEMHQIQNVFQQQLDRTQVLAPAKLTDLDFEKNTLLLDVQNTARELSPRMIVAADGSDSKVRSYCNLPIVEKKYDHCALVANLGIARHHQFCAYERFTKHGPLALLPLSDQRVALIWSLPKEKAEYLQSLPEKDFLSELYTIFGYRLGRFTKVGQRSLYPLKHAVMPKTTQWPFVFIGNAAHTLHPVAGQGFNLGLRDVATLVQCVQDYGLNAEMLIQYQKMREPDQKAISFFTDGLIQLFGNNLPGLPSLRGAGLLAMDNSPLVKNIVSHYARGFAGFVPDLVCGFSLKNRESYAHI